MRVRFLAVVAPFGLELFVLVVVADLAFTLPAELFEAPLGAVFRVGVDAVEAFFETAVAGPLGFFPVELFTAAFPEPAVLDAGFVFTAAVLLPAGFAGPLLEFVGFALETAGLFVVFRVEAPVADAVFLGVELSLGAGFFLGAEFFFVER